MIGYEQILQVKRDAEARLRALPGVHAVGISRKVVGGEPTDELCITVFLVEKKPLDRLAPEEVVPPEIDGVKTDVVEMEVPRIAAADPANLVAAVSLDQRSVTFAGDHDPPGEGLGIWLFYSPTGSADPGSLRNVYFETWGWMTLADIASKAAEVMNEVADGSFTAAAMGARMTLTPTPGHSCAIGRVTVTACDDQRYDYLRGGIQLQRGGTLHRGTLGCLATTAQGKVVALTCHHVVALPVGHVTNLSVSAADGSDRITFGIAGTDPLLVGTGVILWLSSHDRPAFYTTREGDTPFAVATGVAAAVRGLGVTGIDASARSATPTTAVVTLLGDTVGSCGAFGPQVPDISSDLSATVTGLAIHLTGEVSGDDYGVFVNVSAGTLPASLGVYTQPARGATLAAIAQSIAQSINRLPTAVRGGVTAAASGSQVNVSGADEVECIIRSDCRVGQPDNSFNPLPCFNHRIGRVLDARLDIDIALVELDAGVRYKPVVEGISIGSGDPRPLLLTGTYAVQASDLHRLAVLKRGRTSRQTRGVVAAMNQSGYVRAGSTFFRQFSDAVLIRSASTESDPFSLPGDSGSAVFEPSGAVVGILVADSSEGTMITPIDQILAAFPALRLDVAPAPEAGHAPDDVRVVPGPARAAGTPSPDPGGAAASAAAAVTALVERNFAEAQQLVRSRRRVATMWHRRGGRSFLETVLRALRMRQPLPEEIDGRPFAECLERLKRGFNRYASPELAADLSRLGPLLAGLASDVTNRPAARLFLGEAGRRPLR